MRHTRPRSLRRYVTFVSRLPALVVVLALLTGTVVAAGPAAPRVTALDLDWPQEAPVLLIDGHTVVRLVDICRCIGLSAEWDAESSTAVVGGPPGAPVWRFTAQEATITSTQAILGPLGGPPDPVVRQLPLAPRLLDGRMYVPLRGVAEAFGLKVTYDAPTHTVRLAAPNRLPQDPGGVDETVLNALESDLSRRLKDDGAVELTLRVTNTHDESLAFTLPDGQDFDFVVRKGGEQVWRWSEGRMFTMALREITIEPGETLEFQTDWRPPGPGEYQVEAYYMGIGRDRPAAVGSVAID